ncbi:hypothetical protein [Bradyrhizobium sp. NC92]|uniref:hypothetical protein n=1 Tax=Bradyrhizobium sp. (strain NC92) TaxID=55395 RepID=UPI003906005E
MLHASSRWELCGQTLFLDDIFLDGISLLCLPQKESERRFPKDAVERVGGLFELLALKQSLNVAGDRVGRHDERCIERVDVLLDTDPFAWPSSAQGARSGWSSEARKLDQLWAELVGDLAPLRLGCLRNVLGERSADEAGDDAARALLVRLRLATSTTAVPRTAVLPSSSNAVMTSFGSNQILPAGAEIRSRSSQR